MRWLSVFLLLSCLGAIQWTVVVKLRRQNESLHQSAAAFERLRRDNQEGQRLRGDAREIERLREENSELLKLRNEARQSREKIRELEEKLVVRRLHCKPGDLLKMNRTASRQKNNFWPTTKTNRASSLCPVACNTKFSRRAQARCRPKPTPW